jgi:hypothetical protein
MDSSITPMKRRIASQMLQDFTTEGWQDDAAAKLHRLEFYADRELASAAGEAYSAAWSWGHYGTCQPL